jgi:hypothetical protein
MVGPSYIQSATSLARASFRFRECRRGMIADVRKGRPSSGGGTGSVESSRLCRLLSLLWRCSRRRGGELFSDRLACIQWRRVCHGQGLRAPRVRPPRRTRVFQIHSHAHAFRFPTTAHRILWSGRSSQIAIASKSALALGAWEPSTEPRTCTCERRWRSRCCTER